jgi:pimeloyl-ACP methyl ester carboxylesterase
VTGAPLVELHTGSLGGWVRPGGTQRALLLHGGPAIGFEYLDDVLTELDGWTVASFQQRGLPPSTPEGPFDMATAVTDIAAVLDELGWNDGTYLIGHSWGGHLALHAARSLAARLAGVLAVDPIGVIGDGGNQEFEDELLRRTPPSDRARVEEIGDTDDDELADEALRLLWPSYFADPESAPPYKSLPMSQAAFFGLLRDTDELRPELEAALPALTVPLGIVMGAGSPIPRSAGAEVVDRVPGAWLDVVPNAGHFVWLEAPGAVRRALDRLAATQ